LLPIGQFTAILVNSCYDFVASPDLVFLAFAAFAFGAFAAFAFGAEVEPFSIPSSVPVVICACDMAGIVTIAAAKARTAIESLIFMPIFLSMGIAFLLRTSYFSLLAATRLPACSQRGAKDR
jgi:hypothetical protein